MPKILLALGAGCLLVAALLFLAVTWSVLGVGGRTATLVGFTAIYSKRDGIVHWPGCLDPHAVHLEVRSTHCGMGVNPAVYELLDAELHASRPRALQRRAAVASAAA